MSRVSWTKSRNSTARDFGASRPCTYYGVTRACKSAQRLHNRGSRCVFCRWSTRRRNCASDKWVSRPTAFAGGAYMRPTPQARLTGFSLWEPREALGRHVVNSNFVGPCGGLSVRTKFGNLGVISCNIVYIIGVLGVCCRTFVLVCILPMKRGHLQNFACRQTRTYQCHTHTHSHHHRSG
jgi:hypothetical protein